MHIAYPLVPMGLDTPLVFDILHVILLQPGYNIYVYMYMHMCTFTLPLHTCIFINLYDLYDIAVTVTTIYSCNKVVTRL